MGFRVRSCNAARSRPVSERSPTIVRTGGGSFLTNVGTARIWSPAASPRPRCGTAPPVAARRQAADWRARGRTAVTDRSRRAATPTSQRGIAALPRFLHRRCDVGSSLPFVSRVRQPGRIGPRAASLHQPGRLGAGRLSCSRPPIPASPALSAAGSSRVDRGRTPRCGNSTARILSGCVITSRMRHDGK